MYSIIRTCILFSLSVVALEFPVFAQVESPNQRYLFEEDSEGLQDLREKKVDQVMTTDPVQSSDVDFSAAQAEYLQETKQVKGTGGVIVSSAGKQAQAEEGLFNTETKEADLSGDVVFTTPEGVLEASSAQIDVEDEIGLFQDAKFTLEQGLYQVQCEQANKLSETEYALEGSKLSTCHCEDGSWPWCIKSNHTDITQEGYAHSYGTTVEMWGQPIFYTPWLAFPVKQERSSGLLVPEYGYNSRDGVSLRLPLFFVVDDYSDFLLTPIIDSKTRNGASLDYRHAFSKTHSFQSRFYYLNERPRDGNLRGTDITDYFDPSIDEDRVAAYVRDSWRPDPELGLNMGIVSDIHYVSDDLFLREIEDEEIGQRNARFTTSTVALRAGLGDYASMEASGEYNQSMYTDDDFILQRLPEISVTGSRSFRPFGFNPYGLKVTPRMQVTATDFARDEGYDGWRLDLNPSLTIPINFKNYVSTELEFGYRQTYYELDETFDPISGQELEASQDRGIYNIGYKASTVLERAFDLPENNALTWLTGLGAQSQQFRLARVKHTIEPTIKFEYVPEEDQSALPLFDSLDRFRARNLITYGVVTRLYGKFNPKGGNLASIPELSAEVEELPELSTEGALPDIGGSGTFGRLDEAFSVQRGNIRELANFSLLQSFDYKEEQEDIDPNREALSDVGIGMGLYPTGYFGFSFNSNFDAEEQDFSSWAVGTHLRDDRGDVIRLRYSYTENAVSQLEGNLELKLSERLRVGAYTRFDEIDSEFIENTAALRLVSKCKCWHVDVGFEDRINPDREQVLVKFTYRGLGDLTQNIGFDDLMNRDDRNS